MNKVLYKEYLTEKKLKDKNIANVLGITKQAMSYRVNGRTDWSVSDLKKLKEFIGMTNEEIIKIFFD